ncbi:hypothetical protein [Paludibacterium purpuratum]|uniref:Uncharacterized protein n=1 Tax=Paludibacterium purpuratum TaxID=1144873 RepID=A0A4R7B284_9NEIS|nr:hypothetical protein [Paludibacterium purpuratum]TDR77838.1 hypothetical protein DFP86_10978 [Paludibacterium purpuratum]
MKTAKLVVLAGLATLSAAVWAGGQNSSAPQAAMPAMMQPMHAKMQQTMRTRMQQIVNAKTPAERQKLANQLMSTMSTQCRTQMGSGAGMMGSGSMMKGGSAGMMDTPMPGASGNAAHRQHHPANASQ